MLYKGSSSEDYMLQRQRELFRDLNHETFVGWAEEDRTAARRKDMDQSVKEEVKKILSSKGEQTAASAETRKSTFMGSVHYGRAFSHNMQGPIPPVPDLTSFPAAEEVLRVTDEFCDQYRVLRMEVEILQEENNMLHRMLEHFLLQS